MLQPKAGKTFPRTSTLAYWAHLTVMKKTVVIVSVQKILFLYKKITNTNYIIFNLRHAPLRYDKRQKFDLFILFFHQIKFENTNFSGKGQIFGPCRIPVKHISCLKSCFESYRKMKNFSFFQV